MLPAKEKPKLTDVAKACNVSIATVSYILHNKQTQCNISAQRRAQVLHVCQSMNYKADLAATALSELKKNALTMLVLSPWLHTQFSDFMAQVSEVFRAYAASKTVKPIYELYSLGGLKHVLTVSRAAKYDAVLVIGPDEKDNQFLLKQQADFPNVILLNRELTGYRCSYGNDYQACATMAGRIANAGCYRQYVVARGLGISRREQLRIDGFVSALKERGITDIRYYEPPGTVTLEAESAEILAQFPPFRTLYFLPQYCPAAHLLVEAQNKGYDIPWEMGIATYDLHSMLKTFIRPALTTLDANIKDMTRKAVEMAMAMRAGEAVQSQFTEATFISGGSAVFK